MAKLNKTDAAKTIGIARQTLYTYINEGRISVDPDGLIDTSELLRAGFTLRPLDSHEGVTIGRDVTPEIHESDTTPPPANAPTWAQLAELYKERAEILERELADAKKREERLIGIVEEAQKQLFLPAPAQQPRRGFWSRVFSRKGSEPSRPG
jgi:hypothetical protein